MESPHPCSLRVLDQLETIANNLTREKLPEDTLAQKHIKLYNRAEKSTSQSVLN